MILGVIRETKNPPDKRVTLTPQQCQHLSKIYRKLKILVQPSEDRCYSDQEYRDAGIELKEDLSGCEVLMGVKEVKTEALMNEKTYFFFSHTAKQQPYNRGLLQKIIKKGIRLIDYEYLTDASRVRVVAFGKWAGVVGAYNGLRGLGLRSGKFDLPLASASKDLAELKTELKGIDAGRTRIVVTGGGRVASGSLEVLKAAGIHQVEPEAYLSGTFNVPVFTRLDPWNYTKNRFGLLFDFAHFMANPHLYENCFLPYAQRSDMFIACHFWDPRSPVLLTRKDLMGGKVPIRVIADISCDINGPIASTIRASTIADPFYGYDPVRGEESLPFNHDSITVMAVDNLPGELPRDASSDFGAALVKQVLPELLSSSESEMLKMATIAENGVLGSDYKYLQEYLDA